jgi:S-DNA-T family DNA segregation ATPase FtsK/SpoIIIE
MNEKNRTASGNGSAGLEKLGLAMAATVGILSTVAWGGRKRIKIKSEEFVFLFPATLILIFLMCYADYAYLKWLGIILPNFFNSSVISSLRMIPKHYHFAFLVVITLYTLGLILGFAPYIKRKKLQKNLDAVGLTNAQGLMPKVIREIELDENKSKLLITAKGIGLERFEARKSDLESSFERIIERLSLSQDRKTIEVLMCKKELRKMLPFYDVVTALKSPYSFLVGDSANGLLVVDIRDLPHLLIAGSTGGGKSAFFRQMFVCLLRCSPHIQIYLIDLKRGVEVKEFAQLPNVRIAKDEAEAVQLLQALKDEMQKRFVFMEKNSLKKIDPSLHKKDLIVVGIDEASVLYGKTSVSKAKKELVAKARDLTDELAKLARAAGIHLVIATQKAIKESLDTKALENLTGRMIFKMSTHAGSNTALGNVKAYSLPDIKGRGIWAGGNQYIEIQAPYLSEADLDDECRDIADKMKADGTNNHQPMLEFEMVKSDEVSAAMAETTPATQGPD